SQTELHRDTPHRRARRSAERSDGRTEKGSSGGAAERPAAFHARYGGLSRQRMVDPRPVHPHGRAGAMEPEQMVAADERSGEPSHGEKDRRATSGAPVGPATGYGD